VERRNVSTPEGVATNALVFADGEEAVSELVRFARENDIRGAQLAGIGAASQLRFGWLDLAAKRYQPIELDEQVEILSLLGNIAIGDDGQPVLHAHIVVAKRDGTAHGGHLMELHVRPTLELFLTQTAPLRRRKVPDLPLQTIRLDDGS
jgi:predicted DNA-binding protein with PD1-like motif